MKARFWIGSFLFMALISCRNESQQTATDTQATATQTATAAPYDLQFLDTMSKHHEVAIEMSKMAEGKVQRRELKELTKRIPGDQRKEVEEMKSLRDRWYPGAPVAENMQMPGMSASMTMDMSHMQSMKPGKDYDAMFIDMMIPHHQGAIQMAQEALTKAEHPEVKTLAQQIIDKQTKEIEDMKQWKSKLPK
jgi:uncharacterized protein (DUF305 family)